MIRVVLPAHLRTLAHVDGEVKLDLDGLATQRSVLDALEVRYPMLRGTIRDQVTQQRRAFLRFFACEEDLSHELPDAPLPEAVATGAEPFMVVGAMAGGAGEPIVITRVFEAPPERVFKAWTEPERVTRWWGPNGFTTPVCKIDLRPGGVFHTCMRSPEGQDFWSKGVYREIVEPERIVCTDHFSDEAGNVIPPTHYGMSATWPAEALVTVTFAPQEGTTRFTLHHAVGSAPAAERDQCRQGWSESLDRLAGYLAKV
jgi:uncharacterized protein YndB with AHSA1/START domain